MFSGRLLKYFSCCFILSLALQGAAAAAPVPAKAAANGRQPLTLMLEWFVNPDHGPIIVARQKGYFREQGLELTIKEPSEADMPARMAAAGEVDLAVYYQPSLIRAVSDGLPLAWVGTLVATPLDGLLVLEDGPVRSLKDLQGKSIGFTSQGSEKAVLDTMFKPWGFGWKDVKMINVGWNLSSALMAGRVDAVLGVFRNFELNNLKIHGHKGKMFYIEENGIPPYDQLIYITNPHKVKREATRRFLRAVEQAAQFIVNHPDEAWELFHTYKPGVLDNKLNKLAWYDSINRFALRPAAMDKDRYRRYAQFLHKEKEIKSLPDMNTLLLDLQ
ncbi:MAG: ABC transporter substrate-binding protein [Kistimonas sp.]|nr:ABC transporter substrate-binding protein [Kistimonas sp.]